MGCELAGERVNRELSSTGNERVFSMLTHNLEENELQYRLFFFYLGLKTAQGK